MVHIDHQEAQTKVLSHRSGYLFLDPLTKDTSHGTSREFIGRRQHGDPLEKLPLVLFDTTSIHRRSDKENRGAGENGKEHERALPGDGSVSVGRGDEGGRGKRRESA